MAPAAAWGRLLRSKQAVERSVNRVRIFFGLLGVAGLTAVAPLSAGAQETGGFPESEGGTFSITFENDIFGGTDRNYTNGGRIDYVTPKNDLPFWGEAIRDVFQPVFKTDTWYATYSLGQNIFTPRDITDPNPPRGERPYAGFLYGSIGLAADSGDELDTVALDLGVIGDLSFAEEVQSFVHEVIGSDDPKGWDTQLGTYPGFRLLYEKKIRYGDRFDLDLFSLEADVAPHFNFSLGNVDTSAGAGVTFRIGDNLRNDYGPPRVRPAVAAPGFFEGSEGFGWTLFAGAEARVVGYNGFLEGSPFKNERSVDPRRLVADFQAGASLQYQDAELTYTHVVRTSEFEGQDRLSIFGSLNLRVKF